MNRRTECQRYLHYWQRHLGLQSWKIDLLFVDFKRKDSFVQSGDITVDTKKRTANVLLTKEVTKRDEAIILHELIHLLLWKYDHYCEQTMTNKEKDRYFDLLEEAAANLTTAFISRDRS